ncbi:MAG: response regulator [Planctomycetes bacterium]|uniref:response regulator n=1 Tax=Candidatus Wunengus sp. YC65 TaxID=3367701 RepID=UPI001D3816B4|nr:response regulator [Planctomycetota bacterium]
MKEEQIKILFVDDEPWGTEALRLKLEGRGFICRTATDMSLAFRLLDQEKFEVIVTDIMMSAGPDFPNIESSRTGIEFIKMLKNKYQNMQIICLSVIGEQQTINDLKKRGVLYLRKGETSLDVASKLIESKAKGIISF